ncbi:MAG: hypothetical protein AAF531_05600 [Actinomycetota bacterium]
MVDLQTKIPSFAPDVDLARLQGSNQPGGLGSSGAGAVHGAQLRGVERGVLSTGVNRLQGTTGLANTTDTGRIDTGINGVKAHAAVRMHAYPVSAFWAFCPKTKTPHFQRWKVAPS